jgi:hypothetical protein
MSLALPRIRDGKAREVVGCSSLLATAACLTDVDLRFVPRIPPFSWEDVGRSNVVVIKLFFLRHRWPGKNKLERLSLRKFLRIY